MFYVLVGYQNRMQRLKGNLSQMLTSRVHKLHKAPLLLIVHIFVEGAQKQSKGVFEALSNKERKLFLADVVYILVFVTYLYV